MKLSVKSDYAARAILSLARQHPSERALKVEQIAAEQGIPANYLVQILIELKAAHVVRSVRGKAGGYLLARAPAEITLGDLLRCVHGQVFEAPALADPHCPAELKQAWAQLQQSVQETADRIDFQQLLEQSDRKERMYYI